MVAVNPIAAPFGDNRVIKRQVAVSIADDGSYVVGWQQLDATATVRIAHLTSAGVQEGSFDYVPSSVYTQGRPAVAMSSDATSVAAWEHNGNIRMQRFDSSGNKKGKTPSPSVRALRSLPSPSAARASSPWRTRRAPAW